MGKERAPGTRIAEGYDLLHLVGQGGMGEVWKALQGRTGRTVALKFLRGDAGTAEKARFAREARAASAVKSPHVVQIFHVLDDGGEPVIVMELLEGETLAARFARDRAMSLRELCAFLVQVTAALRAAHKQGVVHRDLKPENVFLVAGEGAPTAKLLDFGIARLQRTAGGVEAGLTATGEVLGTLEYMSPEQTLGEDDIDGRSDVWSLGVLAYFLLSGGVSATMGQNSGKTLKNITKGPIRPLGEVARKVPGDLVEIVGRMLSIERDGRPALDEVEALLTRHRDGVAPVRRTGVTPKALIGVAVGVSVAGAGLLLGRSWAAHAVQAAPPLASVEAEVSRRFEPSAPASAGTSDAQTPGLPPPAATPSGERPQPVMTSLRTTPFARPPPRVGPDEGAPSASSSAGPTTVVDAGAAPIERPVERGRNPIDDFVSLPVPTTITPVPKRPTATSDGG